MQAKAVIFDMDGILIDSEPLWKIAEKQVFQQVGIELSTEMCNLTMGYRTDEVIAYWYEKHPWTGKSQKELEIDLVDSVAALVTTEGKAMKGVLHSLQFFKEKGLKIGLASSSMMHLILHVLETLQLKSYFEVVCSAEHEAFGKPHPGVYLNAAAQLGIASQACIAIEDSFHGLIAAKAAKMKTIAVPDPSYSQKEKFIIADVVLESLEDVGDQHWQILNN